MKKAAKENFLFFKHTKTYTLSTLLKITKNLAFVNKSIIVNKDNYCFSLLSLKSGINFDYILSWLKRGRFLDLPCNTLFSLDYFQTHSLAQDMFQKPD